MQQTVDVIAKETEDLLAETILVSGLSYYFYAVADAAMVVDLVAVAVTIAVSGLSSFCSAVADGETDAVMDAVTHSTTTAAVNTSLA